jgi:predicted amidohydrolase
LLSQAQKYGLQIMGGSSTREVNGQYFNTAFFVTPEGKILRQDKLFYTPGEKKWGLKPGTVLKVFETVAGRAVIAICFDSEMPLVSQLLSEQQPALIMIPSWTGSMSGFNRVNWSAQARAVEHYAYVVKTSTVPEKNSVDPHFGQASVISPQDTGFPTNTIDGKYNKADIVFADVMIDGLSQKREKTGYYPIKEQALRKEKIKVIRE